MSKTTVGYQVVCCVGLVPFREQKETHSALKDAKKRFNHQRRNYNYVRLDEIITTTKTLAKSSDFSK